jgi:hypothetical protein
VGKTRKAERHRLRHLDAIDAGREDAAGIAGAFPCRVEAAGVEALQMWPGAA